MLTRHDVETVLGRCEDQRLTEILASGATLAELIEAKRWAAGYGRSLGRARALRTPVVTSLCDLLGADEDTEIE